MSHDPLGPLGPPPRASTPAVSKSMRSNRGRATAPERSIRAALCTSGLRGYRFNWKGAPGRPDIAFPRSKVAVFVNGCYWHRCPRCALPLPKRNRRFWILKFRRNVNRDRRKVMSLESHGWRVLVLWECEIKHSLAECVARIRQEFSSANQKRVRPSSLLPNEIGARPRKRSVKLGGPG